MSNKKNKFAQNLSRSRRDVRGKRADFIADEAKDAQEELVKNLKKDLRVLQKEQTDLEDIWPDDVTSMNPVKKDFNADEWVRKVQANKLAISLKQIEIDAAEETYKDYFEITD